MAYRTHTCGELRKGDAGKSVTLAGWVHKIRLHGALCFIDLRDRYGITQATVDSTRFPAVQQLRKESVITITGKVAEKPDPNKKLATGGIEVKATDVKVLAEAEPLPIEMEDPNTSEDMRLQYRFLDLRRDALKENIILRHRIKHAVSSFLSEEGFLDLETPILARSTPEGARDFLVPSRRKKGEFYALPQSPQLFKQLFMVSGMDKYFQIARCFRDEDLRADRQLEFAQIDIEMSFIDQEDVIALNERMMQRLFKEVLGKDLRIPFPRLTFPEAMERYGSDKPDIRNPIEMRDLTAILKKSDFAIFREAEYITGLKVEGEFTRKKIDGYTNHVKDFHAKGLVWLKGGKPMEGPAAKYLSDGTQEELKKALCLKEGEYAFIIADEKLKAETALGALRKKLGEELGLIKEDFAFVWVVDFPLFEYSEEEKRYVSQHHPFTMPHPEDWEKIEKDPGSVRSVAYDLALNGSEVAGGSIRIHDAKLQERVFHALGLSEEQIRNKFGFLLNAFRYGVPPHGGIAYGLDRLVAIMAGASTIRDVIPFPRNKQGTNPLDQSPNTVDEGQLDELHIKVK